MGLRRGFKTEANAIAREVRHELGLKPPDALNPMELAQLLAIPLVPLSALAGARADLVNHLQRVEPYAFSGVTVFSGTQRLVVFNDSHSRRRQASDITHELAHAILRHEPHAALDEAGCRVWLQEIEEEAEWLAAALLIPDEAALLIARRDWDCAAAAARYCVSEKLILFRLNVTGAKRRVARSTRGPVSAR